jgi:signal transduction histidine kinase
MPGPPPTGNLCASLASLEILAESVEDRSGLTVNIAPELIGQPPPEVERAAFRIAQLAVDNVLAHAEATSITIGLESSARRLRLVVSDNGRGVASQDVARARRAGHVGLADMERRAAIIGGRIHIQTSNGAGTRIEFVWPA